MKRTAALLMAALMALTVCTAIADSPVTPLIVEEIPAWLTGQTPQEKVAGIPCGDFEYLLLDDGTAEIIAYTGPSMFYNNFALESITIPEGVSRIDAYAFFCCNTLKEVVIPEGVTLLDEFVLADCTALEHITLPASLTEIRETALMGTYDTVTYHVAEGSYAEQWCRENGKTFEYTAAPAL